MQLEFLWPTKTPPPKREELLVVGARPVRVHYVRNLRARRYVLRVQRDGSARVTVPRYGSYREAREFAGRHARWLERQLRRREAEPAPGQAWTVGAEILLRGESVRIVAGEAGRPGEIKFSDQSLTVPDPMADLRPAIERHLRSLAEAELPPRVLEFAAVHGLLVRRVAVRNQKSRWGSCSRRGVISLNWRLVQAPPLVRDYIILHELMHLRQMNHSPRFWREVERACPDYALAEAWLKKLGAAVLPR